MSADIEGLLRVLHDADVEFILVGGLAATVHGSARATYDVDVVYSRSAANLERLVAALIPLKPYLRGAPAGLPFELDLETLRFGLNFTLTTLSGDLDLLGEIAGGGDYGRLLPRTVQVEVFGFTIKCLDLDTLIQTKRAAGRPRDLEAIAELEALRDEP
jgi:predicted nucleotidyltransferase